MHNIKGLFKNVMGWVGMRCWCDFKGFFCQIENKKLRAGMLTNYIKFYYGLTEELKL